MASMSMAASSFLPTTTKLPSTTSRRGSLVLVKALTDLELKADKAYETANQQENKKNTMRRDLVFAGVALTACSLTKVAVADEEPKPGTPEAKKKYAPVCVTMPTARICRK